MYNDIHIETGIDSLITNINLSDYYNEIDIDDIDNELPALILKHLQ